MAITLCMTMRPRLARTLGVATVWSLSSAGAPCAPAAGDTPPAEPMQREIVVTATRQSDAAMANKVADALRQNRYIFSDHVTVTADNGVVTVGGVVRDLSDLFAILRLAHRIAGKGRVVNEIEFVPVDDDGN